MSEENRYWFEKVPEGQRYWVLVSWGMPPKQAAEGEDPDLPDELVSEYALRRRSWEWSGW